MFHDDTSPLHRTKMSGLVPKLQLLHLMQRHKLEKDQHVKACLLQMADKFSKADVRLEDFWEDLHSWHPCKTAVELKQALNTGKFKEWCSESAGLKENLKSIQSNLQHDQDTLRKEMPEQKHGSDKQCLKPGMFIKLSKTAEELTGLSTSWKPNDSTMLRHICFVGPGEEELNELESIAKGRHWIELGILFGYHKVPTRKPDPPKPGDTEDSLLDSYDYGDPIANISHKYPRLDKVAKALKQDGTSSRLRFCAHLVRPPFDTYLLHREEAAANFLGWLVECGFQKVLVHLNSAVGGYTESEVKNKADKLLKLMDRFKKLTFILSVAEDINVRARMLFEELLKNSSSTKVTLLYNSSRGGGEEAATYASPLVEKELRCTGYAGGFRPDNVLQKLRDMEWVIPEGRQVFIETQSGVRTKPKDKFSVKLCLEFAENVAKSTFNPGHGAEVYPQHDGTLVLGDSSKIVLQPDTQYIVNAVKKSTFSVGLADGSRSFDAMFIAGSVAARHFEGVLAPELRPDDTRREGGDWRTTGMFSRPFAQIVCETTLSHHCQAP